MASFLNRVVWLSRRPTSSIRTFCSQHFERLSESQKIEEETLPEYIATRFYPVRIGETFASRYQVLGKLGYGTSATAWLARDLSARQYVTLKVFIRSQSLGDHVKNEFKMYQRLQQGSENHPGRDAIRQLLDSFTISGPEGDHECLVHPPLWENLDAFLDRDPIGRLTPQALGSVLWRVFNALDYIHNECHIIHTDISGYNIMFGAKDDTIYEQFEKEEQQNPSPRKEVNGRTIYVSRSLNEPERVSEPVLCDFGSAVCGKELRTDDAQPDVYRAPEIILKVPWGYSIDVWNVGCMVWDLFEGGHLFHGTDRENGTYRGRIHLSEMIALLGHPPRDLINRGLLKSKFFTERGSCKTSIDVYPPISLRDLERNLSGPDKALFLAFMNKMLQWRPEDRKTPRELRDDPWLRGSIGL